MPVKKKKSEPVLSNEDVALLGINYVTKKNSMKELDGECKEIRKPLEAYIKANGKTLESGSILAVVSHADKDVHIRQTLRVGKVLLPEAFDVLEKNGLKECIENVPTIREDVLEHLYEQGKVSDEVLQQIYAEKSSYAFSVELKPRVSDAPEE